MKHLKVLWLGFAVPNELAWELFALDPVPAVQTHKFGWSFARALNQAFGEVTLASTCPVQSFPLVRKLFFCGGGFHSQGMNGVLIGFVNVLLLKHFTRLAACLLSLMPLIKRKGINWIFVHGVHSPYLVFGLLARLLGCHVAVVLTDPPGIALATDSRLARLMKHIDSWLIGYFLARMDAVLALAPDLVLRLAPNQPALVFPGILESILDIPAASLDSHSRSLSNDGLFTIVYAGGLSQAYGVDRLIDAVLGFEPGVTVRLKLYGRGDQAMSIRRLVEEETRIVYGGFVDAATLLPELCAADLLINPRPTSEDFATMSFPSKLIEYLATGRPVLTTRIPSIPATLSEHFYYIKDESTEGIRTAIRAVMDLSILNRSKKGIAAQQFVQKQFSEAATGRKIAEFINNLNLQYERKKEEI
jgi:glycosyltransferase involved in cell wall biosynthesis